MGCPAKKVCNVQAGSALLKNEMLVAEILNAVVGAVDVAVTLKIRTGWDETSKNAVTIATIAEQSGIQALAVHGRTRADAYKGEAEYDTIAAVKSAVNIPVIANGDINNPLKAKQVLDYTGADGLMIGRAAQGNPWIFQQIKHYLSNNHLLSLPDTNETSKRLSQHLQNLYDFYGELSGLRIARKHIGWYINNMPNTNKYDDHDHKHKKIAFKQQINQVNDAFTQLSLVTDFFNSQPNPSAKKAA